MTAQGQHARAQLADGAGADHRAAPSAVAGGGRSEPAQALDHDGQRFGQGGLGLGLAIDYGLFMVSRFREEMAEGNDTRTAVRNTTATAGKTVVFSAAMVAVALSAQATDVGVNKATRRLFPVANTPAKILALGEDGLKPYIATIGLFNAKAKNVIATCAILLQKYGGEVPRDREALEALPGVGRKTANVVLNTAFGEPVIAVDTHIFRVSNRTGLAPGKNVREVEDTLVKVIPAEFLLDAHHWLILHGRYVCKARKPDCPGCVIADLCRFKEKTTAET